MAGRKRRKGPTFSIVNEVLEKQKENQLRYKKVKRKAKVKIQENNTDKILEEIKQARIKFKNTIEQIAKRKSEIEKKTEWHYKMKDAAEKDMNYRYQYAHIVSESLSKNNTIEER